MDRGRVIEFVGVTLTLLRGWADITSDLGVGYPPTLAKEDGVGALQMSVALYREGVVPNPSPEDLLELALELGLARNAGDAFDTTTESAPVRLGAASFHDGEDFVRVWCISDGRSLARITYIALWGDEGRELRDCESIVRSIRFPTSTST